MRNVCKILTRKPEVKGQFERKCTNGYNIKVDLKIGYEGVKLMNWPWIDSTVWL